MIVKINFFSFTVVGNGFSSVDHHIVGEVRMKIGAKLARQINLLCLSFSKISPLAGRVVALGKLKNVC